MSGTHVDRDLAHAGSTLRELAATGALGSAFRSGIGVLLTVLLIPPLLARLHAEEKLLRSNFGGEYDAYCARTWRLIPRLY